jgi:hypothetical protein
VVHLTAVFKLVILYVVLYQISSVGNLFRVLYTYIAHFLTALSLIMRVFSLNLPWFSPFGITDLNVGPDIFEMITYKK